MDPLLCTKNIFLKVDVNECIKIQCELQNLSAGNIVLQYVANKPDLSNYRLCEVLVFLNDCEEFKILF